MRPKGNIKTWVIYLFYAVKPLLVNKKKKSCFLFLFKLIKHFISFFQWWYDPQLIIEAWGIFLDARNDKANKTLYRHDVVDITRQALQLIADEIYLGIKNAYAKNNSTLLRYSQTNNLIW